MNFSVSSSRSIGLALLACAVFLVWRSQSKKGRPRSATSPGVAMPTETGLKQDLISRRDAAEAEFAARIRVARHFDGLYNALDTAAGGNTTFDRARNVLCDWNRRIQGCDAPEFQSAWRALVQNTIRAASLEKEDLTPELVAVIAKAWQNQLEVWGIRKDDRSQFQIDEKTHNQYFIEGDCRNGDTAIPEYPCWMLEGQVLEKGVAKA